MTNLPPDSDPNAASSSSRKSAVNEPAHQTFTQSDSRSQLESLHSIIPPDAHSTSQRSVLTRSASPQIKGLSESKETALITYNHVTYLLYVISYFTAGLLWIVPIFMNYLKRRDADDTWLATHFDWQIKTFWYSIVFFVIGMVMVVFSLGGLGVSIFAENGHVAAGSIGLLSLGVIMIGVTFLWHLYRIIRGWIALADRRPVP